MSKQSNLLVCDLTTQRARTDGQQTT